MEFFDVVEKRQSVRKYKPQAIEDHKLNVILNAANRAPSAGNYQAFEIYVVRGEERQKALMAATFDQKFIAEAPLSLVFCTNASRCQYQPPELYALEDATIACTTAMMAITALGLATCWIGAFIGENVARVIGCPEGVVPMAILPVAYADEVPERTSRRELSDIVHQMR